MQRFSSAAAEQHAVRGWYRSLDNTVVNYHQNFSSSVAWITDEVDELGPWVEVGYIKGHNEWADVATPRFYLAWNTSPTGEDAYYYIWVDTGGDYSLSPMSSLHKYAVNRTGYNSNTNTSEWTFYFDGDVVDVDWLPRPDHGHPEAGGETYKGDCATWPDMDARGRNNGTSGDSDYWCFKKYDNWYRWNPSNAPQTVVWKSDTITFTQDNPRYSYFDAHN
jgi:hypothetical protein